MKVGYVILYEDGELVISKEHTILQKKIERDYGEFDDINVPWGKENEKIKTVRIYDFVESNCMYSWFSYCINLTTLLDFQKLDVSNCKDFAKLFHYCKSLTDISSLFIWNVTSGENFEFMFAHCESLTDISSLSSWHIPHGCYFSWMFLNCKSLTSVRILTNWNIFNSIHFDYMFENCINLKEIFIPNNFKKLNMKDYMFPEDNPNLKIHWKNNIYTYADLLEYETF